MDHDDTDQAALDHDDTDQAALDHDDTDQAALDHDDIERNNWIERYALGRLSVDEQIRFEEHFAECEACVAELEVAQDFDATLRTVVAEDTRRAVGLAAVVARWLSGPRLGLSIAGLLLVALLPSAWLYSGQQQLRDQLERLGRPHAAIPGIELTLDRGSEVEGPAVTPEPAEPWIVLIVDVGDSDVATYLATLRDAAGQVHWRDESLVADPWGLLRILLPRDFLAAGNYQIDLEIREGGGAPEVYGRFPFSYGPSADHGSVDHGPSGDPDGATDTP